MGGCASGRKKPVEPKNVTSRSGVTQQKLLPPQGRWIDQYDNVYTIEGHEIKGMKEFENLNVTKDDLIILFQKGQRYQGTIKRNEIIWDDGDKWSKTCDLPSGEYMDEDGNEYAIEGLKVIGKKGFQRVEYPDTPGFSNTVMLEENGNPSNCLCGEFNQISIDWGDDGIWTRKANKMIALGKWPPFPSGTWVDDDLNEFIIDPDCEGDMIAGLDGFQSLSMVAEGQLEMKQSGNKFSAFFNETTINWCDGDKWSKVEDKQNIQQARTAVRKDPKVSEKESQSITGQYIDQYQNIFNISDGMVEGLKGFESMEIVTNTYTAQQTMHLVQGGALYQAKVSEDRLVWEDGNVWTKILNESDQEDDSEIPEANNHIEAPKERVPVPSPTGTYIVLHRAAITVGPGLSSEMTEKRIEPNQIIEIVEVKHAETRIRGRMKEGGWVSLASNDENEWVWATPYDGKIIPNDPKLPYGMWSDQYENVFKITPKTIEGMSDLTSMQLDENRIIIMQKGTEFIGQKIEDKITWGDGDIWMRLHPKVISKMHPFPSGVFVDKHGRAFEFVGDEVHNLDGFERLEFVRKISRPNLLILTQDGERFSAEFDDKQITWRDGEIWFKKTGEQAKAALEKHKPKTPTSYGKPDDIDDSGGNLHDSNDGWASGGYIGPQGPFVDQFGNKFEVKATFIEGLMGFEKLEIIGEDRLAMTQNGKVFKGTFDQSKIIWQDGDLWERKRTLPAGQYEDQLGNQFAYDGKRLTGLPQFEGIEFDNNTVFLKQRGQVFKGSMHFDDKDGLARIIWEDGDVWKQKKTAQVNFDIDVKKYEVDAHENFELPFECRISTDPKVLSMAFSSGLVKLGEEELKTLQGATGAILETDEGDNMYLLATDNDCYWVPKEACMRLEEPNKQSTNDNSHVAAHRPVTRPIIRRPDFENAHDFETRQRRGTSERSEDSHSRARKQIDTAESLIARDNLDDPPIIYDDPLDIEEAMIDQYSPIHADDLPTLTPMNSIRQNPIRKTVSDDLSPQDFIRAAILDEPQKDGVGTMAESTIAPDTPEDDVLKDAEIAMLQQQLDTLKGALDRRGVPDPMAGSDTLNETNDDVSKEAEIAMLRQQVNTLKGALHRRKAPNDANGVTSAASNSNGDAPMSAPKRLDRFRIKHKNGSVSPNKHQYSQHKAPASFTQRMRAPEQTTEKRHASGKISPGSISLANPEKVTLEIGIINMDSKKDPSVALSRYPFSKQAPSAKQEPPRASSAPKESINMMQNPGRFSMTKPLTNGNQSYQNRRDPAVSSPANLYNKSRPLPASDTHDPRHQRVNSDPNTTAKTALPSAAPSRSRLPYRTRMRMGARGNAPTQSQSQRLPYAIPPAPKKTSPVSTQNRVPPEEAEAGFNTTPQKQVAFDDTPQISPSNRPFHTHPLTYDPSNVESTPSSPAGSSARNSPRGNILERRRARQGKISLKKVKARGRLLSDQVKKYEMHAKSKMETNFKAPPRAPTKPKDEPKNLFERRRARQNNPKSLNVAGLRKRVNDRADLRSEYKKNHWVRKIQELQWRIVNDRNTIIRECIAKNVPNTDLIHLSGFLISVSRFIPEKRLAEFIYRNETFVIPIDCLERVK